MKSQFKNYHTLSFKYLRKIVNLSSNELKNLHDKFVKKINEKEKSKIKNIDFNIKNKNIFNGKVQSLNTN